MPLFGVMLQKIICTDISHSGNFIVEKLINCCVFHSNFFFYEQHLNHEETWPGYASHCETEDSLLLQRFFGHWSSLFVVFFCLKDFRDDFCCSLSERIGANRSRVLFPLKHQGNLSFLPASCFSVSFSPLHYGIRIDSKTESLASVIIITHCMLDQNIDFQIPRIAACVTCSYG